jgi:hypothetical protein
MQIKEYVPTILIVLDIVAAGVCLWDGDIKRGIFILDIGCINNFEHFTYQMNRVIIVA